MNKARSIQLDVLRGVAILLVLGRHMIVLPNGDWPLMRLADIFHEFGKTGVDLFFVLSGYLVGGLLFAELRKSPSVNAKRFIVRRGFKIWPGYFALLIYVIFYLMFADGGMAIGASLNKIVPNLLHIQNYIGTPRPHTWTLAVEEHFYILLPLVLWLVTIRRKDKDTPLHSITAIAFVLLVACCGMRYVAIKLKPEGYRQCGMPTHLLIDGLFFGVWLAYLCKFHPRFVEFVTRWRRYVFAGGMALIAPIMLGYFERTIYSPTIGYTMLTVGFGMIVLSARYTPLDTDGFGARVFGSLPSRALAYVGFYSYSIYLWHIDFAAIPLKYLLRNQIPPGVEGAIPWLYGNGAFIAMAVGAGVIMGKIVERPFLKARDKYFPSLN